MTTVSHFENEDPGKQRFNKLIMVTELVSIGSRNQTSNLGLLQQNSVVVSMSHIDGIIFAQLTVFLIEI